MPRPSPVVPRFLRHATRFVLLALLLPGVARAITGNGKLQIHHIDVGQGDGALLISPNGETALFDDGVYTDCSAIKSYLQGLGITTVDYHFLSHYHSDHLGCLDDLAAIGITIGTAGFDRGYSYSSGTYTSYVNTLGAKRTTIARGQVITLDAGSANPVTITCVDLNGAGVYSVGGSDENPKSVCLLVSYGSFQEEISGDLTGDAAAGKDVESTVGPEVGDVEVYKSHHHGSRYSNNDNWLDATTPEVSVISCGDGNSYGHPTAEALTRLHDHNVKTYWTETGNGATPDPTWDRVANGTIVIQADPGPNDQYTVSGPGFSDTYTNGGGSPPPPVHATEYASALTMLKGSLSTGDVSRLQVSDDSRIGVSAGTASGKYYTDWYASAFLLHPPLNLTITCETSFTVSRTQTLYVYDWSAASWTQVNSGTVGTTDVTKTWSTTSPANYVGPGNEVRVRVKGNNRSSTYTSRGDFMAFDYDYTSGTAPMMAAAPVRGADAVLASIDGRAFTAMAGAPGSVALASDLERDAALHPQSALRTIQAAPTADGAALVWTVGIHDDVDGFNVYRERGDGSLVFAGNEAGLEVSGDDIRFHFTDTGGADDATYWLGVRGCSGPEGLIGPIRVEAAGVASADLALAVSPNPAFGATRFDFALERAADVKIDVFDLQGRHIATPVDSRLPAGAAHVSWGLHRDDGRAIEPGLYFARLQTLGRTLYRRITVVAR